MIGFRVFADGSEDIGDELRRRSVPVLVSLDVLSLGRMFVRDRNVLTQGEINRLGGWLDTNHEAVCKFWRCAMDRSLVQKEIK